ncbi:tail fiber assembly protein [Pectobacterium carotovorum]|uniref:tail fiber assembly protein n=1 Tax=Pectobacterium carotovorum TaxID=554 RepID=UPI000580A467|nr:tail fiber assembly protein [Pectobacterium carotovorum]KHT36630.1 phage tail fiber assembly [Pectobacterium carotovorum subsp. carotovorum]
MQYIYSASKNSFYPVDLKERYQRAGTWPDDGLDVDEHVFSEFAANVAPAGLIRSSDKYGLPCWQNAPSPSTLELVQAAEQQKAALLMLANAAISPLVDAVDLSIATDEEKTSLKEWKTYRVMLNRIDVTTAPDITWPEAPQ